MMVNYAHKRSSKLQLPVSHHHPGLVQDEAQTDDPQGLQAS